MIGGLGRADTAETLLLLGVRPLQNVFLEYVVRGGALSHAPGFIGYRRGDHLEGVMLIGKLGGTVLEVLNADAFAPLAEAAREFPIAPRHIIGHEDVTRGFWNAYSAYSGKPRWTRREPFMLLSKRSLRGTGGGRVEAACEADLEQLVENSALQHREDLKDDPFGADPEGFRERHRVDIREGRWWILREGGKILFQVHIGPENSHAVQIGGILTPPALRVSGHATRGLTAIARRLLERRPAVTLFCDEDNAPALALYRKVGFQRLFFYRSWLLDPREAAG